MTTQFGINKIDSFSGEYAFLSNFFPSVVEYDGVDYPSVEHAYQAAKTTDISEREQIFNTVTPGRAKRIGQKVTIRPDWELMKLDVMELLAYRKFKNDEFLHDKLLATEDIILEEGNTWGDTYWGICDGKGENHLGKILMKVRQQLRNEL